MDRQKLLDDAGERIIRFIRDDALTGLDQIIEGTAKAPALAKLIADLGALPAEHREVAQMLAANMIDHTLHNCMWLLEGGEGLRLYRREDSGELVDLTAISDGLAGELETEDGWIARFSKYPPTIA